MEIIIFRQWDDTFESSSIFDGVCFVESADHRNTIAEGLAKIKPLLWS